MKWWPTHRWRWSAGAAVALLLMGSSAHHARAQAASWPFDPTPDSFSADALLDLRSLNEKIAGETGFVRVGANGEFVRGDGQPLRFWAVNTDVGRGVFVAKPLGP